MTSLESPIERLAALPPRERELVIRTEARKHGMTPDALKSTLLRSWRFLARPKQLPPPGDWMYWFLNCGRGFGKTLTGAQWTKERALEGSYRIGVIAPTLGDVRGLCFEGETGLLNVIPTDALLGQSRQAAWNRSLLELTLANGTKIKGFSSEEPDRVRGYQHHFVWGEEVSSWKDAAHGDALNTTFSNMKLGLRLGVHPRVVLTSTPKPNKLTKELVALADTGTLVLVTGSSYENRSNLSEAWWSAVVDPLEGTRTGRQEIMAEVLEDVEGALWSKAMIDACRVPDYPPLLRIVVGVDPNTTSGEAADAAGIIVAGMGYDRHVYILDDRTVAGGGPEQWAWAGVEAYREWEADRIAVEDNNGGEMCEIMFKGIDRRVPVSRLHASRGKRTRAEPVSMLYRGSHDSDGNWTQEPSIHHVGPATDFTDLEDEMTTWVPGEASPNRMDALVWAITELDPWRPPSAERGLHVPQGEIPGVQRRDLPWST